MTDFPHSDDRPDTSDLSSLTRAEATPSCEHHWVWHCGRHLPSVATCVLCGQPNREDVAEQIADAVAAELIR